MKKLCCFMLMLFVCISLASCEKNHQTICINENKSVYGELQMHVGSSSSIEGAEEYRIGDEKIDLIFDRVEGENLEYFSFQVTQYISRNVTITCLKKIEKVAHLSKIVYKTDANDNEYYYEIDLFIENEEQYDQLEPEFVDICLEWNSADFYTFNNESIILELSTQSVGPYVSPSKEQYQKVINNVTTDSKFVEIYDIKYYVGESYDENNTLSFESPIDFTNDVLWLIIEYGIVDETYDSVYFNLLFDITFKAKNYKILRNMYCY